MCLIINKTGVFNFRLPEFFFSLCLICIALPVFAQYSENSLVKYGVNDGLPSSTCYDLIQDAKGFLWISTEGGLTRYDGNNFKNYNTSDGLVDNEVINIRQDSKGRMWMNTNGPLSYLLDDSVYVVPSHENSVLNFDFKILEREGQLWINRVGKLTVYDSETLEEIDFDLPLDESQANIKLVGIIDDAVIALRGTKFFKYSGTDLQASYDLSNILTESIGRYDYFGVHDGQIYYANNENLYKINIETKEKVSIIELDDFVRKLVFKDGRLWLLTQNSLSSYDFDQDEKAILRDKILVGSFCSKFTFDENDNLWGAVYKGGLIMLPLSRKNIDYLPLDESKYTNLESIIIDGKKIVLGSEKGVLYFIENGLTKKYRFTEEDYSGVNRIIDIVPIPNNGYIISKDSGIYHFKDQKFRKLITTVSKNIYIKGDRLLINTYHALYEASVARILAFDQPLDIKDSRGILKVVHLDRSYTSLIAKDNKIWNATVLDGLSIISEKDTFSFKSMSSMFNCTISRLFELDNGVVCAATKGEGLILFKDKVFKQISVKNGLSSNFCYDIDAEGNKIFVGTNKGVSIIELLDFDSFDFKVRVLDMHDGLLSNEVQDIAYQDSTLFIATNKGFLTCQLKDMGLKVGDREVYIESFAVNGESMPLQNEYVLSAFDNNIKINLISPNIGSKRNIVYEYRMNGVDDNWIKTTSTETRYRNLESGKYEFLYRLSMSGDEAKIKSVELEIEPRIIHSSGFKLMILAALGCLFMVPLYLNYSSQKRNVLASLLVKKSDEVNEKMKLLEKSNKRLVSSNKELEQFAYIASHDLQEPINTIKGFTDVLTKRIATTDDEEALKMLNMISNSSTRMKELVKALLVYSRIGKEKKKSMVDMNSLMVAITKDLNDRIESNNAKVTWDNLPYIPGYEVELRSLIQNLMSNAMKFQRPGIPPVIHISSSKREGAIEFSVKDNGIGISKEYRDRIFEIFQRLHNKDQYEGTGIGLAHCKKIVNLHNGQIWIESVPEGGSNFKFTIEI